MQWSINRNTKLRTAIAMQNSKRKRNWKPFIYLRRYKWWNIKSLKRVPSTVESWWYIPNKNKFDRNNG